jgi:hypothetical protein
MSERGQVEKTLRMIRIRQAVRRACDATGLGSRLISLLILALLLACLAFGVVIAAGLSTSSVMATALVSFTLAAGAGLFLLGTAPDDELAKAAESLESELQRIEAEPPPTPVPPPVPAVPAPVKPKIPPPAPAPSRATQPAPAVQFAPPPVQPAPKPAKATPAPSAPSVDLRTVVVDIIGYDPLARCAEHPQQSKEATLMLGGFSDFWVAGGSEFQEEMLLVIDGVTPEMNGRGNPNYWMMAKLIQEEVRPAGWENVTYFGNPVAIGTRPIRVAVNGKTIGFLKQNEGLAHRKKMDARGLTGQTVEVPVRIYPPAAWSRVPGYGALVYLPNVYCSYMDPPKPEKPRKPRSSPDPKADLSDYAGKVVPLWSPSDMADWVSGQRSSGLNDELKRHVLGCALYQEALRSIAGKLKPVRYPESSIRIFTVGSNVPLDTKPDIFMTVAELYIDAQPPANRDQIENNGGYVIEVGKNPVRVTIDGETVGFFEAAAGRYHRKKLRECGIAGAIAQVPAEINNFVIRGRDGTEVPTLVVMAYLPKVYKA